MGLEHDDLFFPLPFTGSGRSLRLVEFCEDHSVRTLAALPWVASEIAGNDGFAAMLLFVSRWSGTRFYVPRRHAAFVAKVSQPMSSRTHARLLKGSGSSGLIDVPSAWGVFLALRRIAIDAALDSGVERDTIARRFGVTERSLRKLPSVDQ